jgi:hypothetical protein
MLVGRHIQMCPGAKATKGSRVADAGTGRLALSRKVDQAEGALFPGWLTRDRVSGPVWQSFAQDLLHGSGAAPAPHVAAEATVDLMCAQRLHVCCRRHVPYLAVAQYIA